MAKLEEFFRRSLSQPPPPATPPVGQWERIRQEVSAPPGRRTYAWSRFVAGVVVGMLLVGMGGWLVVVAPALRRPNPVSATATGGIANFAGDTVVRWRVDTVYVDKYLFVGSHQPTLVARLDPLPAPRFAPRLLPPTLAVAAPRTRSASSIASLLEGVIEPVAWQQEFSFLKITPAKATRPQRNISTVPAEGGWKYFTVVPPPQRPAGRWELGVHLRPQLISGSTNVETLAADSTQGFKRGTFTVAGEELDLYGFNSTQVNIPIRPRLLAAHVQVARQFSSGLRLGFGMVVAKESDGRPPGKVLDAENSGTEYFLYRRTTATEFQGLLIFGYTFRLRRHLQVTTGLALGPRFRANQATYDYIFSEPDNRHFRQGLYSSRGGVGITNFDIFPQLSLHYHLNDRLSVGTEIVPGVGLGARYKF